MATPPTRLWETEYDKRQQTWFLNGTAIGAILLAIVFFAVMPVSDGAMARVITCFGAAIVIAVGAFAGSTIAERMFRRRYTSVPIPRGEELAHMIGPVSRSGPPMSWGDGPPPCPQDDEPAK